MLIYFMIKFIKLNVFYIIWNWFFVIIVGLKVEWKGFFKSIKFIFLVNFNNVIVGKLIIKEFNFFYWKCFLI